MQTVVKAGGFYIGRYEAGAEGGKLEEISKNEQGEVTNANWKEEPALVCKKGATVYNYIRQEYAKTKAKTFIDNSDVKSALISGRQGDVTMNFINGKPDGNNKKFDVKVYDANNKRKIVKLATSGQNIADKVCNIYDLEGNGIEYIAERNSFANQCNMRGGCCTGYGINEKHNGPTCRRNCGQGTATTTHLFRFVLYVI